MSINNNTVLRIENLSVKYDENLALNDINFSVNKGDFIAIVGSNGAGKSTLINAISGIIKPFTGRIEYSEEILDNEFPYKSLGFSPQKQVIDWYLDVNDNIMLGALLAGETSKTSKKLTEEILGIIGLKEKQYQKADSLSGGQQQRIQIARALVHKPNFIILDEPTVGLDVESTENLLTYLKRINKSGTTIFISSHDLDLLEKYCDKILFIEDGEILYYGVLAEFINEYNEYNEAEVFNIELSSAPTNRIKTYLEEHNILVISSDPLRIKVRTKDNIFLKLIKIFEEENISINSFNREKLSLRELYLNKKGWGKS